MNTMSQDMKTFEQAWTPLSDKIHAIVNGVSEDRRPFVEKQVGNSLLFGSALSFVYFNRSPLYNQSALNEALELRASAYQYYVDDEERLSTDVAGIIRWFTPGAPVKTTLKKGHRVDPLIAEIEKMLTQDAAEIAAKQLRETEYIAGVLPYLEGFLSGAAYDRFDLMGSEMSVDRARSAAVNAVNKITERVHNDVILCGGKLEQAKEKFKYSNTFANKESVAHWYKEYLLATNDRKTLAADIKAAGLDS